MVPSFGEMLPGNIVIEVDSQPFKVYSFENR